MKSTTEEKKNATAPVIRFAPVLSQKTTGDNRNSAEKERERKKV